MSSSTAHYPFICCIVFQYGGHISGEVDESGAMTGDNISYWYPGGKVGLQGQFQVTDLLVQSLCFLHFALFHLQEGVFVSGSEVKMVCDSVESVSSTLYHRDVATRDCISLDPLLCDPYESKTYSRWIVGYHWMPTIFVVFMQSLC